MGRPKKEISEKIVFELAQIQCTMIEIAAVCDCSVDTLENRFSDIIKKGKQSGKKSLRRIQFALAEKNPAMAIWLGKQYLGQRDAEVDEVKAREFVTNIISYAGKINENKKAPPIKERS